LVLALGAALAVPVATAPAAGAAPPLCTADVIQQALIAAGKLTQEAIDGGMVVDLIRCGDVTADGTSDAVFTIASGGTAGDIRFGVLRGNADGATGSLVLYRSGYKTGIARHNARSFDVILPHYASSDANCCPSSFRVRRYTWTGSHFKAGKATKLKHPPRRFYKP
jgi:hypothetical protein